MQYSQEHLKTMVYAKFGGANRVYYGELAYTHSVILVIQAIVAAFTRYRF